MYFTEWASNAHFEIDHISYFVSNAVHGLCLGSSIVFIYFQFQTVKYFYLTPSVWTAELVTVVSMISLSLSPTIPLLTVFYVLLFLGSFSDNDTRNECRWFSVMVHGQAQCMGSASLLPCSPLITGGYCQSASNIHDYREDPIVFAQPKRQNEVTANLIKGSPSNLLFLGRHVLYQTTLIFKPMCTTVYVCDCRARNIHTVFPSYTLWPRITLINIPLIHSYSVNQKKKC